jgi:hypothetical protein
MRGLSRCHVQSACTRGRGRRKRRCHLRRWCAPRPASALLLLRRLRYTARSLPGATVINANAATAAAMCACWQLETCSSFWDRMLAWCVEEQLAQAQQQPWYTLDRHERAELVQQVRAATLQVRTLQAATAVTAVTVTGALRVKK